MLHFLDFTLGQPKVGYTVFLTNLISKFKGEQTNKHTNKNKQIVSFPTRPPTFLILTISWLKVIGTLLLLHLSLSATFTLAIPLSSRGREDTGSWVQRGHLLSDCGGHQGTHCTDGLGQVDTVDGVHHILHSGWTLVRGHWRCLCPRQTRVSDCFVVWGGVGVTQLYFYTFCTTFHAPTSTLEFGAESVADNRTIVKSLSSGNLRGTAAFSSSWHFFKFLLETFLLFLLETAFLLLTFWPFQPSPSPRLYMPWHTKTPYQGFQWHNNYGWHG